MSIIYNAFDFDYMIQYIPLVIYIIVAAVFIVYLVKHYTNSNVDLVKSNLKESLIKVIAYNEKFKAVNYKLALFFLCAGFLYLLSSTFKVAQNESIGISILYLLGGMFVSFLTLFIAHKLGAFKGSFWR
ncbi:MAG: hypothetical protein M3512_06565 [Bacteroidota bacterium]|nr:hypothetical protein [Bacteroidota bacterium]